MAFEIQKGFCVETSMRPQGAGTIERKTLVLTGAHPMTPVWASGSGEGGTHGHSQVGFHSRSGWEGRSCWWSPEAGNLFDNGRAPCFRPAARTEGRMSSAS